MTTIKQRFAMALAVGCLGFATAAQGATTLLTFDGATDPNPRPACSTGNISGPTTQICTAETFKLGNDYGSSAELAVRYARTVNVANGTTVSPELLFLYADGNGVGSSFGGIGNAASIFFTPTAGYEVSFDSFDFVDRNSGSQSAAFSLTDALGNSVFSFTSVVGRQRTTYTANTAFFTGPLTLTFDGSGNASPSVDNIQLTTRLTAAPPTGGVPEPATWAMMLFGFGSMGFVMRRPNAHARIRFA